MQELPKVVEKIKTTKGCYSLEMRIRDDKTALLSISDTRLETLIRLDEVDLKRIKLLIEDHI